MPAPSPHRCLRFSLRALLIFMAIGSALFAWRVKAVRDVDRAVTELRKVGFEVTPYVPGKYVGAPWLLKPATYEPPPFWKRVLYGEEEHEWKIVLMPPINDTAMRSLIDDLHSIGRISLLDLDAALIGNETLRGVSSLRNLRFLEISGTEFDDRGLAHLESMTWLEELEVGIMVGGAEGPTPEGVNRLKQALAKTTVTTRYIYRESIASGFTIPTLGFQPNDAGSYLTRGDAHREKGKFADAIADYEEAMRLAPKNARAHARLARLLATCPDKAFRDGKRAVAFATNACELSQWNEASLIDTLAAACAELDDFENAVKWIEKAIELKPGDSELQSHRALFKSGRAFRDAPPKSALYREA